MPRHGPQTQSRNSRYMGVVANVRQQQELACLHRPAIDASAVLFDENPKDPTLYLTPYESPELVVVTVVDGERSSELEPTVEGVPIAPRAPINYTYLDSTDDPAPLKFATEESLPSFLERMWRSTGHFRVLSRIPPKTPEPATPTVAEETPPVVDLDSDSSSAASVEFLSLARRSSVPINPYSDSSEEELVAPKTDAKLLKKCSVSLTRLDVPSPLPTNLERSVSSPSALSMPQPSTSTGKFRIPKKKAPDAILGPYQSPLLSISDKLRAIRQAAEKDKEKIAERKRRPVEKTRSEKCEEQKEKGKRDKRTEREKEKRKRERKKAKMIELFGEETDQQDSDSDRATKKKLDRKENKKTRKEKTSDEKKKDSDRRNKGKTRKEKESARKEKGKTRKEKGKSEREEICEKDRAEISIARDVLGKLVDDVEGAVEMMMDIE